jgi:alkylation response protein AidB-like acyl-CoA dehydrogenase
VDLHLSEEQTWLAESVAEMLTREAAEDGTVPAEAGGRLWRSLLEFGALEPGDGLGAVELALVARGLGIRLAPVPFVDTAALRYALARSGAPAAGDAAAALCLSEPERSFAPAEPGTTLEDGRLDGEKAAVSHGGSVDLLAVTASAPDGLVLALVPAGAAGVATEPEPTLDPTLRLARVRLDGVDAGGASLVSEPAATPLVEGAAALAGILAAAEAAGAAAAVLARARDYAAQRRQFGRTIGSFQAVRHLLADMYVQVESSWSSVLYAAASLDEEEPASLRTASIAKAYTARATHAVAHGALQVFAGIAFTAEHPAHRFLRRIVVRGSQFGTAREHERSLGRGLARSLEVRT